MELFSSRMGDAGCYVIETVLTIFALGLLGIFVAITAVFYVIWKALNES